MINRGRRGTSFKLQPVLSDSLQTNAFVCKTLFFTSNVRLMLTFILFSFVYSYYSVLCRVTLSVNMH